MADDALTQIDQYVKETPVLIFMKGNPQFPMCGFSAATIQIFDSLGVPYQTVDVLQGPCRAGWHQTLFKLADDSAGVRER